MTEPIVVDIFAEDQAHAALLEPLLSRIATEEGVAIDLRVRWARGGHGRAIHEFRTYQKLVEKGATADPWPDVMVVCIDGNCSTLATKRKEIMAATAPSFAGRVVAACPDPHVECWYLADPDSFHEVVGYRPALGKKKCIREHYKNLLADAVRRGGNPPTLGGIEFASELTGKMDLYRAGRNDSSLKAFLSEFRQKLRQVRAPREN
jgi:hypothetical protein